MKQPKYQRILIKLSGERWRINPGTALILKQSKASAKKLKTVRTAAHKLPLLSEPATSGADGRALIWTELKPTTWACLPR